MEIINNGKEMRGRENEENSFCRDPAKKKVRKLKHSLFKSVAAVSH